MAPELELADLFSPEVTTELAVNGELVTVIAGLERQNRSEYDVAARVSRRLLLKYADFPSLYLGESMDVEGVSWVIEDLDIIALGAVEVELARYLS